MKEQRLIELLFEVKQGDKSPNQAWKEIMNLFNNGVLDDVSQQRELLKGFANRFNKSSETYILEGEINKFLKTFNCG
tara:strand:+ start:28 stop:258 length:231 start_codon:yes stop_codon:yes gene_type:complete